jgi:hypothetical protein
LPRDKQRSLRCDALDGETSGEDEIALVDQARKAA